MLAPPSQLQFCNITFPWEHTCGPLTLAQIGSPTLPILLLLLILFQPPLLRTQDFVITTLNHARNDLESNSGLLFQHPGKR